MTGITGVAGSLAAKTGLAAAIQAASAHPRRANMRLLLWFNPIKLPPFARHDKRMEEPLVC